MFWKKKCNVGIVIQWKAPEEDHQAHEAEAQQTKKMLLGWFPKNLTVDFMKTEWNTDFDGAFNKKFEIILDGKWLLHTNGWIKEGFFSTASAEKHQFVKSAIEGAISGKIPEDVVTFKKELKMAKDKMERDAMDEANEFAEEAKKNRIANEEARRQEKAAKLAVIKKKEEERLSAVASQASSEAVPKAKPKPKAKNASKVKAKAKAASKSEGVPAAVTKEASLEDIPLDDVPAEPTAATTEEVDNVMHNTTAETQVAQATGDSVAEPVETSAMQHTIQPESTSVEVSAHEKDDAPKSQSAGPRSAGLVRGKSTNQLQAPDGESKDEDKACSIPMIGRQVSPKPDQSNSTTSGLASPQKTSFWSFGCCRSPITSFDAVGGEQPLMVRDDDFLKA